MRTNPLLHLSALLVSAAALLGNAGVFDGPGTSPELYSTDKIQMVAEAVDITILPADGPVRGDLKNRDYALYECQFTLKNLTPETVSVQVGFPLSSFSNGPSKLPKEALVAQALKQHAFRAEADGKAFSVRYAAQDRNGKFSSIFTWDMTFAPHETRMLKIAYTMQGYAGLGMTIKRPYDWQKVQTWGYLEMLCESYMQSYSYVTETGTSWAPPIERAQFTLHHADFEAYLVRRGYLTQLPEGEKDGFMRLLRNGQFYRLITEGRHLVSKPSEEPPHTRMDWKPATEAHSLQWTAAPFNPKSVLLVDYIFTTIPKTVETLPLLLELARARYDRDAQNLAHTRNRLKETPALANDSIFRKRLAALESAYAAPFGPEHHKNIADVILEFYSTPAHNPAIQDFLDAQSWYPAENPPPLDPALKEALLRLHDTRATP